MDMTKEEFTELFQLLYTQQQQLIDINMLILKNHDAGEADFLDWVHNSEHVFLSQITEEEFENLQARYAKEIDIDGDI